MRRLLLALGLAFALVTGAQAQSLMEVPLLGTPSPSLNLVFTGCPAAIDSRISFTAANSGKETYFGSDLLLHTAATNNAPSLAFDPNTGACLGLQIFQGSTNLALYARDLTQVNWVVSALSSTALDQVGIDGAANSASSFTAGAPAATVLQTPGLTSVQRTYSVYIKCITCTGAVSITPDGTTYTTANSSACFHGFAASNLSTSFYVRCQVTATVVPIIGIKIANSGDKIAVDYGQLEALAFPTPAILTAGSTVTRAADVATMATSAFGFVQGQGTFFVSAIAQNVIAQAGNALSVDDTTLNNDLRFLQPISANQYQFNVRQGGSQTLTLSYAGSLTANVLAKYAVGYSSNTASGSINGGAVVSGSGTIPTVLTNLQFGNQPGNGAALNGWLQQVEYWPQRLPNQQLIQKTRPGQQSWLEPANDNEPIKLAVNQ